MKAVKEVLIEARKLIANGWCKSAMAKNSIDFPVDWNDASAVKFCMVGALSRVCSISRACHSKPDYDGFLAYSHAQTVINNVLPHFVCSLADINDDESTTQEKVLGWFDAAIATCKD